MTLDPKDKCPSQMSAAPVHIPLCNVTLDNKSPHVNNSCTLLASIVLLFSKLHLRKIVQ